MENFIFKVGGRGSVSDHYNFRAISVKKLPDGVS